MPYDDIKFMENEETATMHINQAFEWSIANNRLTLKVFSYNKTLRIIELNENVTRKFVAWLLKNFNWPDDVDIGVIKDQVTKQLVHLNKILTDLENPSGG